ncbi:hypothetical protein RMSM_00948 [Rhodopirellula maiorica SM1]|uniref:Uncharacterized protein n=1 Tax=Rhodopirellula maiorica SM1 TaxID=1265738 RepID=M5RS01_9BACT|nr:hypothetical protein RMSM_00948 [Rhodopirellula maiorica SM1]
MHTGTAASPQEPSSSHERHRGMALAATKCHGQPFMVGVCVASSV